MLSVNSEEDHSTCPADTRFAPEQKLRPESGVTITVPGAPKCTDQSTQRNHVGDSVGRTKADPYYL